MKTVQQINKKTGVTYIYEIQKTYWDKDKQQARNKQVCIGKLDPDTAEFIPSKRLSPLQAAVRDSAVTATVAVTGPAWVLDHITRELELDRILRASFPDFHQQILSMAYFLAARGDALSHIETWSKSHRHPAGVVLSSQRVSEILTALTADRQATFFSQWLKRIKRPDYLCYDITSVSSYAEVNEYLKYGYNRDLESLRQINLAVLYGQKCGLPVYYQRLPGNISDVKTLDYLLQNLAKMDFTRLHYVLDKGFFSQTNVDNLVDRREKFTLALPLRLKWLQRAIDEIRDDIEGPQAYRKVDDEVLYVHSRLYPWGKDRRRCYLHLYYNAHAAAEAAQRFNENLLIWKEELDTGQPRQTNAQHYAKFFTVKTTPKRGRLVHYNEEAVRAHRKNYVGFLAILSHASKSPMEALQIYRDKDAVEKCFDDLKNQLDLKRLRIHSARAMDGRLFVQFIALIYISYLRKIIRAQQPLSKYTARELLLEMETFSTISYSGKYGHLNTVLTKPQKEIINVLGIESNH